MALTSLKYSFNETTLGINGKTFGHHLVPGSEYFEQDLSPNGGNMMAFDSYMISPNSPFMVETEAQVPGYSEAPSIIMDLSDPVVPAPVLDTPAIIDSIVDELPFPFNSDVVTDPTPPMDDMTLATGNAKFDFEVTETYQDITQLLVTRPLPSISCSPAPLGSPTNSIYSDVTQSSSTSLLSAASTSSRDTHFLSNDFEVLAGTSGSADGGVKLKKPNTGDRYSAMRIRNNMASRRSRLTRRERERDMESQLSSLLDENASLKSKVRNLEELVEKTKKIIIQAVAKR